MTEHHRLPPPSLPPCIKISVVALNKARPPDRHHAIGLARRHPAATPGGHSEQGTATGPPSRYDGRAISLSRARAPRGDHAQSMAPAPWVVLPLCQLGREAGPAQWAANS
jgi:hypothetical protein